MLSKMGSNILATILIGFEIDHFERLFDKKNLNKMKTMTVDIVYEIGCNMNVSSFKWSCFLYKMLDNCSSPHQCKTSPCYLKCAVADSDFWRYGNSIQIINVYKCDGTDISWGEMWNTLFNFAFPRWIEQFIFHRMTIARGKKWFLLYNFRRIFCLL